MIYLRTRIMHAGHAERTYSCAPLPPFDSVKTSRFQILKFEPKLGREGQQKNRNGIFNNKGGASQSIIIDSLYRITLAIDDANIMTLLDDSEWRKTYCMEDEGTTFCIVPRRSGRLKDEGCVNNSGTYFGDVSVHRKQSRRRQ